MQLPSHWVNTHLVLYFPNGNGLSTDDLEGLVNGDLEIHNSGPMLTVPGTILQNNDLLRAYQERWSIVGLEMEGIPYIKAIEQAVKRKKLAHDIKVLVGYYASDAPLNHSENLSTSMGVNGLTPTYALSIAILHKLFG